MASRSLSTGLRAVVLVLVSSLLSGCFFAAEKQLFTVADFTYVDPIRLEVMLKEFGSDSSRRVVSITANPDGKTVRIRFIKSGRTSECDIGFVLLGKPAGYYILTSTTESCAFFTDSAMVLPYYYMLVANVSSERIKNRVMKRYVQERTATFIWPYFLGPTNDEYDYLMKLHRLEFSAVKEELLFARAFNPNIKIPEGPDQNIEVLKTRGATKEQFLGFIREAIGYRFFQRHVGSEIT